jgi:hypothetical protein
VHNDFYDAAMDSGWFEEVYTDEDCTVLFIRDQKGAPPPGEPDADDNAPAPMMLPTMKTPATTRARREAKDRAPFDSSAGRPQFD